jgi:general secretion pathway protein L
MMRNEQMTLASLSGAAGSFFRWWREELVTLLPSALRHHLQYNEHQLVIYLLDEGVRVADCHHGQPESSMDVIPDEQGGIDKQAKERLVRLRKRSGDSAVIKLPHSHTLSLSFSLPLEAEKNLHEVVGYELGRHAPFKIDQVYYDYQVIERRREEKKLRVKASVVPRKQLAPMLSMVREWGFTPAVITVEAESEEGAFCHLGRLNLLPPPERDTSSGAMNRMAKVLALTAVLLGLAVAGYPLLQQELAIAEMQSRVASVKAEAVNVQSMQQELERLAEASNYVKSQKQQLPEVLDVLNALSLLLPDDTWLERFEMKGERIRMQGMSQDASSLIELLENSPLLQKVSFDSPIVKDPRSGHFRFQIVAELVARGEG